MKKLLLIALVLPAIVSAQSYPSPTFNSMILQNPLTPANGGTGATTSTGTGSVVLSNSPSLASPTITGSLTATGLVTLPSLATQAANTVIANATGSSASPSAFAMPSCSGTNNALRWTSGTGFSCASSIALTSSGLNQFASTTSAQLAGVVSDETGTGALVFGTNPAFAGFTTTAATTFGASANLSYSTPAINLNDTSATNTARTSFQSNGTNVWALVSNSPSGNLQVNRYVSGTLTDQPISISNSTGVVTMPDGLTVNGTVSGTGFSSYLASPPAIGGTAANTGAFTTLTASTAAVGTNSTQVATTAFIANREGCKNILDFGGNNAGGGAAANNTAWTNAIAAQSATNSVCVYFPRGSYLFNAALSYTIPNLGSSITIVGDGSSVTNLVWPTATNGITLTTKDWTSSVHVRGLTLQSQGAGTSTGLTITQGAASVSNPANTAQSDITDVTFMGSDGWTSGGPTSGTKYWSIGTQVTAVSNINYISDMWLGAFGSGTGLGSGVVLSGSSSTQASVVHNFTGCNFIFNNVSITMGTWVQGVALTATNITEDNQGVVVNGTAGMVQLAIANSQFSTYSNDVAISGPLTNASITNNLFYVGGSNSGIVINNSSAADINIANNQFFPGFSASSPNGVAVLSSGTGASNLILGNVFNSLGTAISLSSSAGARWGIGSNSFAGNTANYSFAGDNYSFTNGDNLSGNGCGTGLAAATTYYLGMCQATTLESSTWLVSSKPVTAARLSINLSSAPGGSATTTATLRVNGADTALTCTVASGSTTCSDVVHTVAINTGNLYDVKLVTGSGAATTAASWGLTLVP